MPTELSDAHNQLFIMSIEVIDASNIESVAPQHLAWLKSRYEDGTFVVSGRLLLEDGSDSKQAMAILRTSSLRAAKDIAYQDPLFTAGICRFQFKQFNPRMHTEAFSAVYSGADSTEVAIKQAVR